MVSKRTKQNRYRQTAGKQSHWWKWAFAATAKICLGVILLVATSLGFILAHDVLLQSDYFSAQRLSIAGCNRLSRQEVLAQAGLKPGVNTLSVNLSVTRKKIMSHPWIADAKVRREFPGALHVRIREEEPLAIISLDRAWLLNKEGKIFKEATKSEASGLPVVIGLTYTDIPAAGTPGSTPFNAVMEFLDLGRQPRAAIPNRQIEQIGVDREVGLTVTAFGGGKTIRVGYGDYPQKVAQLQRLINFLKRQGEFADFVGIDLNSPDRMVATPVAPPLPEPEEKEA